ncbi:MAG: PIN domain-containing protein [Thermoproteota archaeon]|nr:PIN domain-containing protein [Thermoproteota archaeon]
MSAVVDTNVLIFDTFEDSEFHTEAMNLLDSLERWILPSVVFHEYVWFMKGEKLDLSFSQEKVTEYLTHAKTNPVHIQVDDILFSTDRIKEYRDYNDFLILSAAKRMGHPLLTFDERLKKQANQHGVRTL